MRSKRARICIRTYGTLLEGVEQYRFDPIETVLDTIAGFPRTFEGYRSADGRVGTRNEIWSDLVHTRDLIASRARHPNAGRVRHAGGHRPPEDCDSVHKRAGTPMDDAVARLPHLVAATASGAETRSERNSEGEIAIWKQSMTV